MQVLRLVVVVSPIKRIYTWPNVVEIIFYHQIHTQVNGDPSHGACDLGSTSRMSTYAPHMSPKVEGVYMDPIRVIWYTMKQIYDKHKEIWWAQANVDEGMTWDDSTIPRCHLFALEAQEGHLAFTQKLDTFHSIIDDI